MPKTYWKIKDSDGNVINTIVASEDFVVENYADYELVEIPANRTAEREWRDSELDKTDSLALLPDYPNTAILLEYRQALRDWPSTVEFPNTRPESLESRIANSNP